MRICMAMSSPSACQRSWPNIIEEAAVKTYRSMVLVSSDPHSMQLGAQNVYRRLVEEVENYGLQNEISITMVGDLGRHDCLPMVMVYPEAVVYGPVQEDG